MAGMISVAILIVATLALGSLASRAWRLRAPVVRWVTGISTSLIALILALLSAVGLVGIYRLDVPHSQPTPVFSAAVSPAQLTVGQRRLRVCAGCHSTTGDVPLNGGTQNFLAPQPGQGGGGLGAVYAPNLTPAGPLKDWTDGQVLRAIREGVDKDGRALIIMPSSAFRHLSDGDAQLLVAALRAQSPVARETPARDVNLLGLLLIGAGLFPTEAQPPITQPVNAPPTGVTVPYGKYLADVTGCAVCHGENLTGRVPGQGPPAGPNLTQIVPTWSEAQFLTFFRTGKDPQGRTPDSAQMPWKEIGQAYTDDELHAMYVYLHSLPTAVGP